MYGFHGDGRNARLLGDEPVLFFDDGARRSIAIEAAIGKHTFDIDTTKTLASAFDAAWLSLQTSGSPFSADDRAAGTRDLLAQRIIEIAQRGERDRQRIVEEALAQFESSKR